MSKTIVPFAVPMAYVTTGVRDIKCGWPILFSAAQRLSEVQVVIGAAGDGLVLAVVATGLVDRGVENFLTRLASDQFNEEVSLDMIGSDEMISSGWFGVVAHPAKKIAATNRIAGDLDTQPLCGWGNRTQAVLLICDV
jgi:hypothetical protein